MKALLFPGQGSQLVGMGSEFYKNFKEAREIFKIADERLNYSITKIILEGPPEELQLTKNTQPAILTVSYAIFKVLKNSLKFDISSFKYFAGHSLGEYTALVCAEAIQFSDAIYLLHERGKAMQNAVPVGEGDMIAVLGMEIKEIINLINQSKKNGVCEIANDNAKGQVIVSGDTNEIKSLKSLLKEKKIKSIPLKVSAPFHCTLMKPAAEAMKDKINTINFNNPKVEIINNVNANVETNSNKIKELLINQIFSSVRWRESIIKMSENGVNNFIEIGPGKALSGMVKRTLENVKNFSVNSLNDIEDLKNEF
tara:strand:+ start:12832 stop:13764 length:933 start_codon:yes stop_codon:yes gene_type:complete